MFETFLIITVSLILCHAGLTSYKSGESKEKYIVINNKTLAKIFIDSHMPFERKKSRKDDKNKLSIYGLIGYILNLISVLIFLFFTVLSIILHKAYAVPFITSALVFSVEALLVLWQAICYVFKICKRR